MYTGDLSERSGVGENVGVNSSKSLGSLGEGENPFTDRKELLAGVKDEMVGVLGVLIDDFSIGLGVLGCDVGLTVGSLLCSREDFGSVLSFRSGTAGEGVGALPFVMRSMVLLSEGRMWASSRARSSGPLPLLLCLEPESASKGIPEGTRVFRLPVGFRLREECTFVCSWRILSESEEPESEMT
jgi:hypothetical protein